jgi:hypothetical protein
MATRPGLQPPLASNLPGGPDLPVEPDKGPVPAPGNPTDPATPPAIRP